MLDRSTLWVRMTGQADPLAGPTPSTKHLSAWLVSVVIHLALLVFISMMSIVTVTSTPLLTLITNPEPVPLEPEVIQQFAVTAEPTEQLGAASSLGTEMALGAATQVSELSVMAPNELAATDWGAYEFTAEMLDPSARHEDPEVFVQGLAGEGVHGAEGAIDRIAHEILLSIEERPTLVIWLFDQSASLISQREKVVERFERVYDQLGVLAAEGNSAFRKHSQQPLLTSVWAFGQQVTPLIARPTTDVEAIKESVRSISLDDSGVEQVFTAVYTAVNRFKGLRSRAGVRGEPERNVMVVVFSDEAGDDAQGLDQTIALCRRLAVPVYVVGVPAPFGVDQTVVRWVDPDPQYDQTVVSWPTVDQGPESLLSERVVLPFTGDQRGPLENERLPEPLDSGFGPYALTRLCAATGGIYFTVHPNRVGTRFVSRGETQNYTSYLKVFFDAEVMRRYRPDYVSTKEYQRLLTKHPVRRALVEAAQRSQIERLADPERVFVKRDQAQLAAALTESQKDAAKLQPQIDAVFEILSQAESERDTEFSPRWQAGYDLALGTVAAVKVRTESYNAMLAQAKRGMEFADAENNTWVLAADDEISVGSRLESLANKSREYLQRVVDQHPGTPWAYLAARELKEPLGWKWHERYTNLDPPPPPGDAGTPPPPSDDERQMLPRKQVRPAPKL